jgi:Zn-dependent oligopeptidase
MNEQPHFDYSEHVETHRKLNRELLDKLITRDYNGAITVTEEMIASIRIIRAWCMNETDKS